MLIFAEEKRLINLLNFWIMIKKVLLFAAATIGLVACSKDDNKTNNDNRGGNISKEKSVKDKLLGEWIGTYDII